MNIFLLTLFLLVNSCFTQTVYEYYVCNQNSQTMGAVENTTFIFNYTQKEIANPSSVDITGGMIGTYELTCRDESCTRGPYAMACFSDTAECTDCRGYSGGTRRCDGPTYYTTHHTGSIDTTCFCYFLENIYGVNLTFNDGTFYVCETDFNSPDVMSVTTQLGGEIPTCEDQPNTYGRYLCYISEDPNYASANQQTLKDVTFDLYQITSTSISISNINRLDGRVTFTSDLQSTSSTYYGNVNYVLYHEGNDILTLPSNLVTEVITIPDSYFWSNYTFDWQVTTTDSWGLGNFTLGSGSFDWDPNRKEYEQFCYNGVAEDCLSFEVAQRMLFWYTSLICLGYTSIFLSICAIRQKFFFNKKLFSRAAAATVIASNIHSVSASCTISKTVTSSITQTVNNIETHVFTGTIFLSDINGKACLQVKKPNDDTYAVQIEMQITDAYFEHDLVYMYNTFSKYDVRSDWLVDCPQAWGLLPFQSISATCPSGHCDNKLDCGGLIQKNNKEQTQYIDCYTVDKNRELCGTRANYFGTAKVHHIFNIRAKNIYKVYRVGSYNLKYDLEVKMNYLNGTIRSNTFTIDTVSSNTITPILTESGIEVFNNGISNSDDNIPFNYILYGTGGGIIGKDKGFTYYSDANDVNIFSLGKPGEIQCDSDNASCDYIHSLCSPVYNQANCGQDSLENLVDSSSLQLPRKISGKTYSSVVSNDEPQKFIVRPDKIGTSSLYFEATTEVGTFIADVTPLCSIAVQPNGCFNCETGFTATLNVYSSSNAGQVSLTMTPENVETSDNYGLYTNVLSITTTSEQYKIYGYTGGPSNRYKLTLSSRNAACSVTLSWTAFLDDRTADLSDLNTTGTLEADTWSFGNLFEGFGGLFGGLGGIFDGLLGGFGNFVQILVWIGVALLIVCCGLPLIKFLLPVFKSLWSVSSLSKSSDSNTSSPQKIEIEVKNSSARTYYFEPRY